MSFATTDVYKIHCWKKKQCTLMIVKNFVMNAYTDWQIKKLVIIIVLSFKGPSHNFNPYCPMLR